MFEDLLGADDFILDPEDIQSVAPGGEGWDSGIEPDIFASGETPDLWSTKS